MLKIFNSKLIKNYILSFKSAKIYKEINKLNNKAYIVGKKYNIP